MKDCFGVAMCAVDVATLFEFPAVISVIVDLAVVDDLQRVVFVGHRLMTGGDVDNAQAAMTEADATVDKDPGVVRSAMPDHVAHPDDRILIQATSRARR